MTAKRNSRNQRDEFDSEVVEVRRVARMMAGGRRFGFRCFAVAGDRNGRVGIGIGKGNDVSTGIEKAIRRAKESASTVPIIDETIPFPIESEYQTSHILLKPAAEGRGIIAGGVVRTICELAGVPNVTAKILGRTKSNINNARATMQAFERMQMMAEQKGLFDDKSTGKDEEEAAEDAEEDTEADDVSS